jgi:hypothetical protein
MKHPKKLDGLELDVLAKQLSNLSYDSLCDFLTHLSDELYVQYRGDMAKGRGKLANNLLRAIEHIEEARYNIESAWKICAPYQNESESK